MSDREVRGSLPRIHLRYTGTLQVNITPVCTLPVCTLPVCTLPVCTLPVCAQDGNGVQGHDRASEETRKEVSVHPQPPNTHARARANTVFAFQAISELISIVRLPLVRRSRSVQRTLLIASTAFSTIWTRAAGALCAYQRPCR